MANRNLIFDVGAHLGEDTEFYVRKGFCVVAVEANPTLADKLRERFRRDTAEGTVTILETAIAEAPGEIDFFVNDSLTIWGTIRPEWAERNASMAPSHVIKVRATRFRDIIEKYGTPYYVKVDIEGADLLCLADLVGRPEKPQFVSIESDKRSWKGLRRELDVMREAGYSKFKLVDQSRIGAQQPPIPAREGCYVKHTFEGGSSGLFGRELPGKWLTKSQALWRYRFIFLWYWLFGDYGVLRFLLRTRALERALVPPWYDTHATS